jgi:hypothetical protein
LLQGASGNAVYGLKTTARKIAYDVPYQLELCEERVKEQQDTVRAALVSLESCKKQIVAGDVETGLMELDRVVEMLKGVLE